jgi:RimJ/RimL family protein N-acetyltransferase
MQSDQQLSAVHQPRFSVECDNEGGFEFINRFFKVYRSEWQKAIVQKRDGEIIAAVLYQDFNGSNVFVHVAAEPGKRWLTRDFLYWTMHYPFVQLGARRMTGWVEVNNFASRRFDEHVGFKEEAVLKGAGQDGQDVILYVMHREDCRHV